MHWLKLFTKYYRGDSQQLVLINAFAPENYAYAPEEVKKFLLSFNRSEPNHPIFNFLKIEGKSIIPVTVAGVNLGSLRQFSLSDAIDLKNIFEGIAENTNVTLFKISSPGQNCYKDAQKSIAVEREFCIYEFDALSEARKTANYSEFGLGANDFGLLHDIDGVAGTEQIENYLQDLTPNLKKLIFQNEKISIAEAKRHLAEVPTVFAYLSPGCGVVTLELALQSPIIKEAIASGSMPLFLLTQGALAMDLPQSITDARKENKIRIVKGWLSSTEYRTVNSLFMNREANSIIIPSGDNTLTLCIKTGKFPFYAHKLPFLDEAARPGFKHGVFKAMLKILDNDGVKQGWNNNSGFSDCHKVLTFLSKQADKKTYNEAKPCVTQNMLKFFNATFAPYLMDNFAFERKTLPRLLIDVRQYESILSKSRSSAITVKFDALQVTKSEKPVINTAADKKPASSGFGFKKGFLT